MTTFTIVRPEHLNHHGYLFGGQLLKWVDEYAWLTAARDFPGHLLVTRAMESINFTTPVPSGSILRFDIRPEKQGVSSITYAVGVFSDEPGAREEKQVFSTRITFACVDDRGGKRALPLVKTYRSMEQG
jgi:acyl-CoA hydrolase